MKELVKQFVPPICFSIYHRCKQKKRSTNIIKGLENKKEKIVILGNGPSLNTSLRLYSEEMEQCDKMVVNFFGSSDMYETLKPNIYLLVDPIFFKVPQNQKNSIERLLDNIITKTSWKMHFYLPATAKGTYVETKLLQNKNIIIDYFICNCNVPGGMNKNDAWDKNVSTPIPMNVLNIGIYLSIYWRYKEVYIIGADFSFIEDIRLDQKTNKMYTIIRHFYNDKNVYAGDSYIDQEHRKYLKDKVHEQLNCLSIAAKNYWELKEYADYAGVKVYNASEYSWIDAFERRKLG